MKKTAKTEEKTVIEEEKAPIAKEEATEEEAPEEKKPSPKWPRVKSQVRRFVRKHFLAIQITEAAIVFAAFCTLLCRWKAR